MKCLEKYNKEKFSTLLKQLQEQIRNKKMNIDNKKYFENKRITREHICKLCINQYKIFIFQIMYIVLYSTI